MIVSNVENISATIDDSLVYVQYKEYLKAIQNLDNNKVNKIEGKGLSTNDYTTTEKNKLSNIADGATANAASDTIPKANGTAATGIESEFARGDHIHPLQTSVSGNAGTATKLKTAKTITLNGAVTGSVTFDGSANKTIQTTLSDFDASKITSGTIDIARLPAGALETIKVVADDTARYKLTINDVQNGDCVKVTSTNKMYMVKDQTKLSSADGYEEFVVGTAAVASSCTGNAATATKANKDSAGQQINTTYIKGLSVNGKTITYTKGDGTTGTIITQDTNTTYSNFVKSGSGAKAGLVPAPSATAGTKKYLREDGTWAIPPNTTYSVASATMNGLMSKEDKSKLDDCLEFEILETW